MTERVLKYKYFSTLVPDDDWFKSEILESYGPCHSWWGPLNLKFKKRIRQHGGATREHLKGSTKYSLPPSLPTSALYLVAAVHQSTLSHGVQRDQCSHGKQEIG